MTADEMKAYALATFEGVNPVENAGDTFLIFDPDRVLAPQRWMPFATIVTGDHYDTVSDLTARGAYRINMGLTKATYLSLFGPPPKERDERGILRSDTDYTAVDTLMPHPFYASQYWVSVVNPGAATLDTVRRLLAEAYAFAVRKYRNHQR